MGRIECYRTRPRLALSEEAILKLRRASEPEALVASLASDPVEHSNFQMVHALSEPKALVIETLELNRSLQR